MILQSIGLFSHGLQATAVLYDSSICTCRSSMGCDVLYIYLPVIAFRVSCLLAGGVATGLWLMAGFSPTFDVWDLTSYSFCIFNVYHLLNRHAGGIFTPNPSSCHLSAHQTRRQQTDHAISFLYTMISPEQKKYSLTFRFGFFAKYTSRYFCCSPAGRFTSSAVSLSARLLISSMSASTFSWCLSACSCSSEVDPADWM